MDSLENSNLAKQNNQFISVDLIRSNQDYLARNYGGNERASEETDFGDLIISKKTESADKVKDIDENSKKVSEGLWEQFAKTTTGHGFARMIDKKEPLKFRIFWGVVVTFLLAGLLTSVFMISYDSLFVKGLRREFTVQHNSSLNLPDIHICDTSLFNATILKGIFYTLFAFLKLKKSDER